MVYLAVQQYKTRPVVLVYHDATANSTTYEYFDQSWMEDNQDGTTWSKSISFTDAYSIYKAGVGNLTKGRCTAYHGLAPAACTKPQRTHQHSALPHAAPLVSVAAGALRVCVCVCVSDDIVMLTCTGAATVSAEAAQKSII